LSNRFWNSEAPSQHVETLGADVLNFAVKFAILLNFLSSILIAIVLERIYAENKTEMERVREANSVKMEALRRQTRLATDQYVQKQLSEALAAIQGGMMLETGKTDVAVEKKKQLKLKLEQK